MKHEKSIGRIETYSGQFLVEAHSLPSEKHPDRNEDAYFCTLDGTLGVFDGLGGHAGSEVASELVRNYCRDALAIIDTNSPIEVAESELKNTLLDAQIALINTYPDARVATTAIIAKSFRDPETSHTYMAFAQSGDSRAYVLRDGVIVFESVDHSQFMSGLPLAEQLAIQQSLDEARYLHEFLGNSTLMACARYRNIVSSCLSSEDRKAADVRTYSVMLQPGDIVLLTSDGIHDNLTTREIIASTSSDADTTQLLVAKALERSRQPEDIVMTLDGESIDAHNFRSKPDDMTAVILRYDPSDMA